MQLRDIEERIKQSTPVVLRVVRHSSTATGILWTVHDVQSGDNLMTRRGQIKKFKKLDVLASQLRGRGVESFSVQF